MRVELLDKVTGPANRIMGTMDKLTKQTARGFANIGGGAVGLWGVNAAINSITADSREMNRAVGEVASLSVADDALKNLQKTALGFSIRYGESATDFVRSSYDIQSAIAGLVGNELGVFTNASNVLAKGTKADAATITNYMGTMYGIFKNQADSMGKAKWVEQLTGQTAQAVEMFKTNGVQMSGAFTSLGADATAHGVAINEQMAVLGKLQATMSGSEAGTKYKAFLRGVGNAQEELGMKFTDSAGRMLPVDQILSKLQGKFGAIDTVAKSDMLKKAFGSDEAVAAIKLLIADTGGLTDSITTLGNVRGMDKARAMAEKMVDPLDRVFAASTAVKIGFGSLIQKAMLPFYDTTTENLSVLSEWIDKYPHLFGALAKLTIMVAGVVAVVSLLAIVKGMAIIAGAGLTVGMTILRVSMVPFGPLLKALRLAWVMYNFQLALGLKTVPAMAVAMKVLRGSLLLSAKAAWVFTAALMANPITWIVVGVVALIAGLVLLIKNWDVVKGAAGGAIIWIVEKWQAFRSAIESTTVLKFLFYPLLATVDVISFLITSLGKIPEWFGVFKGWLANLNIMQGFTDAIDWIVQKWQAFRTVVADNAFLSFLFTPLTIAMDGVGLLLIALEKIPAWFANFKQWLSDLNPFEILQGLDNLLVGALNLIPGVNIEPSKQQGVNAPQQSTIQTPASANRYTDNVLNTPAQNAGAVIPLKTPAVAPMPPPSPVVIPASLKVENISQPAPVVVPAELKVSEAANLPAFAQVPVAVPNGANNAENLEASVSRERESIAPRSDAPVRNIPQGGLMQQINNNNTNNNKGTSIGSLTVNTNQKVDGYSLHDQLKMAGG